MEHISYSNNKHITSPQENNEICANIFVTQKTIEDIQTIVKYLWKDEQKNYYETSIKDRKYHIFLYLKRIKSHLNIKI